MLEIIKRTQPHIHQSPRVVILTEPTQTEGGKRKFMFIGSIRRLKSPYLHEVHRDVEDRLCKRGQELCKGWNVSK